MISPQGYSYGEEPESNNPFWSDEPDVNTNNVLAEVTDSVVENTDAGYDYHTIKETEYNGTVNDVGSFYVARKQITALNTDGSFTTVDQAGQEEHGAIQYIPLNFQVFDRFSSHSTNVGRTIHIEGCTDNTEFNVSLNTDSTKKGIYINGAYDYRLAYPNGSGSMSYETRYIMLEVVPRYLSDTNVILRSNLSIVGSLRGYIVFEIDISHNPDDATQADVNISVDGAYFPMFSASPEDLYMQSNVSEYFNIERAV